MCKGLKYMGTEFRRGRPEAAPMVKDDEELDLDCDVDDETRDEVQESWKRGLEEYEEEEEKEVSRMESILLE